MKMDTISKVTLAGLVLSILVAVAGWVTASRASADASDAKTRAGELLNLAQTVTQERVERIAGDALQTVLIDKIPERVLALEQAQSRTDANVDILLKKYEKDLLK